MQDHGNNHKYCRKADRCKHFRIRKYLQVILEAYKFIDTCKDTDIKEAVFHSHQNGIYCCKASDQYNRQDQKPWYPLHSFLLIVMELSSLFIKQCKADFYLCFTLLFFYIFYLYISTTS